MKSRQLALSLYRLSGILLAFAIAFWPAAASAGGASFPGQWQQVARGTGVCAACRVDIRRSGPVLRLSGKDGWVAVVHVGAGGSGNSAEGIGRWSEGDASHYGGKPFDIRVAIVNKHLYMDMLVRMDDGSTRAIRAIFDKRRSEKSGRLRLARM
ncbi:MULTISPECIES: hypothetical protein [unclassified Ensifer]|uniref:hypothetical protein n=1 Tax=unclassified Ensifer TaxID=2633371 RepID=UPI0008134232|nr:MULTISPECIES: hypothetical protein [unclassified Ensifer]OCP11112.1 hypothetical protein BC362_01085 [Ensifer sp. LC14]OCP12716.1 hypothetical protein BC374_14080 [Ensifer sp. LC13]OCP13436.1 hypothetical protein BBX50_14585 [Ensifer sp. LC11]OCP34159.1 hypothetical protein BC364_12480 [Ensifer sp. LC499]